MSLYELVVLLASAFILVTMAAVFLKIIKFRARVALIQTMAFIAQLWASMKLGYNLDWLDYAVIIVIILYFIIELVKFLLQKKSMQSAGG